MIDWFWFAISMHLGLTAFFSWCTWFAIFRIGDNHKEWCKRYRDSDGWFAVVWSWLCRWTCGRFGAPDYVKNEENE